MEIYYHSRLEILSCRKIHYPPPYSTVKNADLVEQIVDLHWSSVPRQSIESNYGPERCELETYIDPVLDNRIKCE